VSEQRRRRPAAPQSSPGGRDQRLAAAAADALAGVDARTVVLVEGISDRVALQTMAARRGRDLAAEGVGIVPMGGARSIGRYLELFGPSGLGLALAGLCDAGEEGDVRRGLERAGLGSDLGRAEMASLGFFVCVVDLEDELLRRLGAAAAEQVVEGQGELGPFRTFQRQPAQRERGLHQQLHRFMGTGSGRKIRYARLLVDALDLENVPEPLDRLLGHV
jgi:hypothetical protein